MTSFAAVRQFVQRRQASERCDLCGSDLSAGHEHLFEPGARKLLCSCQACAILFPAAPDRRYKRVPRRILFLPSFQITDEQWNALMLPINMAFFFKDSTQNRVVALFPSPAGATESMLPPDAWQEIETCNPLLTCMEPDVEALLVNRLGLPIVGQGFGPAAGLLPGADNGSTPAPDYYLAPIDHCFKLTGLSGTHWRGLSGGAEVWREIAEFFSDLKARSHPEETPDA